MSAITDLLIRHEGMRFKPYRDTVGKLTIGVGRNLDDVGITHDEAVLLLANDVDRVVAQLNDTLPWWVKLDEVRRAVLIDMGFNLGVAKLLTFHRTLELVEYGKYSDAALAMLDSVWAAQVGTRANELSEMMKTGQWTSEG